MCAFYQPLHYVRNGPLAGGTGGKDVQKIFGAALDSGWICGMVTSYFGFSDPKYGNPARVKPAGFTASGASDHLSEWRT